MKKLFVYPNCSKGGMTSVIRGRAAHEPDTSFDFIAWNDVGGRDAFDDLPNVSVRIVPKARIKNYLNFILQLTEYDEIALCFCADLIDDLKIGPRTKLIYEFHSSYIPYAVSELKKFDNSRPIQYRVPSESMLLEIEKIASSNVVNRLVVEPNLVDSRYFNDQQKSFAADLDLNNGKIPLFWVGRIDRWKGLEFFLRVLSKLPF